jgi:hypothetical protein
LKPSPKLDIKDQTNWLVNPVQGYSLLDHNHVD